MTVDYFTFSRIRETFVLFNFFFSPDLETGAGGRQRELNGTGRVFKENGIGVALFLSVLNSLILLFKMRSPSLQ